MELEALLAAAEDEMAKKDLVIRELYQAFKVFIEKN